MTVGDGKTSAEYPALGALGQFYKGMRLDMVPSCPFNFNDLFCVFLSKLQPSFLEPTRIVFFQNPYYLMLPSFPSHVCCCVSKLSRILLPICLESRALVQACYSHSYQALDSVYTVLWRSSWHKYKYNILELPAYP